MLIKKFIFITENKNNYMRKFALKNNILCFDHDPNIGGRFSIFSITSLLPLLSIGHSLPSIIKSFNIAKKIFHKNHSKLSKYINYSIAHEKKFKLNILVGLSYHDKVNAINEWYRQIFAESLGKNKRAKNYISSYGSIDQHSQFQLYIDGPHDKHFYFFKIENRNKKILIPFYTDKRTKNKLIKKGFTLFKTFEEDSNLRNQSKNGMFF